MTMSTTHSAEVTLPGDSGPLTPLAFDNHGGARRLTEHLLSLGHRRIGYVTGPAERSTTGHRLAGHRAALAGHGMGPGTGAGAVTLSGPAARGVSIAHRAMPTQSSI